MITVKLEELVTIANELGLLQDQARQEVIATGRLLMEQALAVRGYTSGQITKLLATQLQTEFLPDTAYKSDLEPTWEAMVELLSTLYGKPIQKGPLPAMESLTDGTFTPSHLWALDGGGGALLGTACEGKKYQLVVRFTQKKIQAVAVP